MATTSAHRVSAPNVAVDDSAPEFGNTSAVSGVRRATRPAGEQETLTSVLVEIDSGRVLGPLPAPAGALPVSEVVSAVPEIFGAQALLKHRLLGEMAVLSELLDLVLISPTRVHVLQRVPAEPARALVSVAGRENSVGWVVSEARSRLERT